MDWFPLLNSVRVALISTALIFLLGIWAANGITRLPAWLKGAFDTVLTLPLVLPPTVVGFFLLKTISPKTALGSFVLNAFGWKLTMTWFSAIFATTIVAFPLMYRTARGAFEQLSPEWEACAETMGLSKRFIFWRIKLPNCRAGLLAGVVLSFARALGEYGATSMVTGYIPGKTATVATTVYQLWREGNDALAYRWVLIDLGISMVVLIAMNLFEKQGGAARAGSTD
ncbi:MAG TPA: molybdate ABC transporter permease subunit [Candidatus Limiplasma sp.]|nr:molybdate ABC transporter permease subunit [Candidatus Limiplasma sp.]HPS82422.1 molybdate ABC transporter permease subunit [Candidatus Limiplasma sp.]